MCCQDATYASVIPKNLRTAASAERLQQETHDGIGAADTEDVSKCHNSTGNIQVCNMFVFTDQYS